MLFDKFFFRALSIGLILTGSVISEERKSFFDAYPKDFENANFFLEKNINIIESIVEENSIDSKFILPVVFPELMRYSILRDKMEIMGLKVFYVKLGNDYANFSIGSFQMKPSFAEKLENITKRKFPKADLHKFSAKSERDIRLERIRRLEDISWQTKYLFFFYKIIEERFGEKLKNVSEVDKIKFFSIAYNSGFHEDFDRILNRAEKNNFPYGNILMKTGFTYSDVALEYYSLRKLQYQATRSLP